MLTHSNFDRCLLFLPWVKDYQIFVHTAGVEGKLPGNIGIALLLSPNAPQEDIVADKICEALKPVLAQLVPHEIGLYIRIARNKAEFEKLFACGPKRLFVHMAEPLDKSLYLKL